MIHNTVTIILHRAWPIFRTSTAHEPKPSYFNRILMQINLTDRMRNTVTERVTARFGKSAGM
jgi:hypothetical protein